MTTSTLELVDWATILDDEPACENPDGCDRPAVVLRKRCCGCPVLNCRDCWDLRRAQWARIVASTMPSLRQVRCASCDQWRFWPCDDEPWTVVPL